MPSITSVADRISYLKGLHVQWTTQLQQLVSVDPDRALHLAEALDDLKILIGVLERESLLTRPPRGLDARPSRVGLPGTDEQPRLGRGVEHCPQSDQ